MKKFITVLTALCACILTAGMLFGCGETETVKYSVIAPDGATVAALADMWGENVDGAELSYVITAEDNLKAEFAKGTDFIVAPVNVGASVHLAAQTAQAKFDYRLMNVTSWGVLYIVSTENEYNSVADTVNVSAFLKQFDGKTVATIGREAIPGKSAEYLFGEAAAAVELIASDAATIQQRLTRGDKFTAVLGEPAITALKKKNVDFRVLCSVSDVYFDVTGEEFPMAGMFVRSDIADSHSDVVEAMNERTAVSVERFNADPEAAGDKAAAAGSTLKGAVLKDASSKMNMKYKSAADSAQAVTALLSEIGITVDESLYV